MTQQPTTTPYCGRFAPSPTGLLHFGSLLAAVGSYADAKANQGRWLLRIDDIDQTRCRPDFEDAFYASLEAFGMPWDGPVSRQTDHLDAYQNALDDLSAQGLVYACDCSRAKIKASAKLGLDGPIYPGTCRERGLSDAAGRTLRIRVDQQPIDFVDRLQGQQSQQLADTVGDFVIRRADGLFAYQLGVVIDDHLSGVNAVVRGADLLGSTARQIALQRHLGMATPSYLHLPLAVDANGRKFSKRDAAQAIDEHNPLPALRKAWAFLGQLTPPDDIPNVEQFWDWAIAHWRISQIPKTGSNIDD